MKEKEEKTVEWYLEHLPSTIEFPWLGAYGGPYTFYEDKNEDKVRWSKGRYTYGLEILKNREGRWKIHYVLPGYDGDSVCLFPEACMVEKEAIENNDSWLIYGQELEDSLWTDLKTALENIWTWLESKNLV